MEPTHNIYSNNDRISQSIVDHHEKHDRLKERLENKYRSRERNFQIKQAPTKRMYQQVRECSENAAQHPTSLKRVISFVFIALSGLVMSH